MSVGFEFRAYLWAAAMGLLLLFAPNPVVAQDQRGVPEHWVLDKYGLSVSGRFNSLDTKLRVDSEELGVGTEIDAEDLLGLESNDTNWDIQGEVRLGDKHQLFGAYTDFVRENSRRIEREITIGETVFPVDALVQAEYDIETWSVGYRYFPWVRDTWALGFGLGLRWYDFRIATSVNELERREEASVSAPMPFVGADLRFALSPRFRAQGTAGFFDVELGDLGGTQVLAAGSLEYLLVPNLTFGAGVDVGQLDVDVDGDEWNGASETNVVGLRLFAKVRS